MTYDPRLAAPDPAGLWPPPDSDAPPSPQLLAQVLDALPRQASGAEAPAFAADATPDGETPRHVRLADAIRDYGRSIPGRPAQDAPVPMAARIPPRNAPVNVAAALRPARSAAGGESYRPELSGGPDDLVRAYGGSQLAHNPFDFVVDPQTGAVSRWTSDPGGDLQHPKGLRLEPVGPAEKQRFLEWMTGARANYAYGAMSPEEQTARVQLQQGVLPGAKGPPISATASGKVVTYREPDGSTFPFPGNHPDRDQNPQNIEWKGGFAQRHGAIGRDGPFAIFPSLDQARQASMALMHIKATNGVEYSGYPAGTLANVIRQLSPPQDNNKTEGMIQDITSMTGLDRNTNFESLTPEQRQAFARAYERREGHSQIPPPPDSQVR